ncbi:outer membrane protein assembly factor BamC [Methylobacter svalbardensis]|uniref:outer membrane protein assembly factor BamC n=1 Tax=Methylobacter svalbardensis TaxID=3080016 RepID=UPI0030EF3A6F
MKTKISLVFIVAVLLNVSACTYIKNLFPDKEKDYQFTTEIPPLVLPPDLANDSVAKVPSAAPVVEATDVAVSDSADEAPGVEPTAPQTETDQDLDRKSIQVELVDADQGTKRLRIGASSITAWRMVGKALSRNSIEVPNRNQEERLFHVQYDPNKRVVEDGSFWDEVVFFFTGFETAEQEYVLELVEDNQKTDVIIMSNERQPVADQTSLRLLTLLHDTIKADLAK